MTDTRHNTQAAALAKSHHGDALPEPAVQVFTSEPTGWQRLADLDQVAKMPDGTVVIWNDLDQRQAGVLETQDGDRVVRPISIGFYEHDWHLSTLTAPVWVITFDDPPTTHNGNDIQLLHEATEQ